MFIMFINICCCYCSIYNINWLFFLLKSKLLLIIKHFCLFLISFLLNSIPCCRIAISDFVFSCKNFSVSESVLLRFDVDCFSSFSIDFCFIVPPKVSNDFLRMSFFFFAASSSAFFLLLFAGVMVYFLSYFKSLYYIGQSNVSSGLIPLYLSSSRFCFLYVFSKVW